MKKQSNLAQQLAKNSLSIISLVIALIALTYNTWRSNTTELNRNYRNASFELILQLSELQSITNDLHFNVPSLSSPDWQMHHNKSLIDGWSNIALIEDLSELLPTSFQKQAEQLKAVWKKHHTLLGEHNQAEQLISNAITQMRKETRYFLRTLD